MLLKFNFSPRHCEPQRRSNPVFFIILFHLHKLLFPRLLRYTRNDEDVLILHYHPECNKYYQLFNRELSTKDSITETAKLFVFLYKITQYDYIQHHLPCRRRCTKCLHQLHERDIHSKSYKQWLSSRTSFCPHTRTA